MHVVNAYAAEMSRLRAKFVTLAWCIQINHFCRGEKVFFIWHLKYNCDIAIIINRTVAVEFDVTYDVIV